MIRRSLAEPSPSADPDPFSGAHDVKRRDDQDKKATDASIEIERILREDRQDRIAQQAFFGIDTSEQSLIQAVDDEDGEGTIFDQLGDHLSERSNLSTLAKIQLMQAMLDQQEETAAFIPKTIMEHAVHTQKGAPIQAPVVRSSKKYGPKRKGNP